MVSIYYGDMPEAIYNPALYFKNTYTDDWIIDDLSKAMIKDVDKSDVIGPRVIDSPVLGGISPRELSGGVKTLMCMYKCPNKIFNASACGDNCAKWILHIAEELQKQGKDLLIRLGYLMDFGEEPFEIEISNLGKVVHNSRELAEAVLDNALI